MFISEYIGEDYQTWKPGDVIIINAQTGMGKTYFVLKTLLPYVAQKEEMLLYLSNRNALRDQVELAYDPELKENICVMNYQKFQGLRLSGNGLTDEERNVANCGYFVMDEAHYFLSDSAFNGNIERSLTRIRGQKGKAVLIFITATPEYLMLSLASSKILDQEVPQFSFYNYIGDCCDACPRKPNYICPRKERRQCTFYPGNNYYACNTRLSDAPIIQRFSSPGNLLKYKELPDIQYFAACGINQDNILSEIKEYFQNIYDRKYKDGFFPRIKKECRYYDMERDYTYIDPVYFLKLGELCNQVINTPNKEKWLIFVPNRKIGEDIRDNLEQLSKECGTVVDTVLISSQSKNDSFKGLPYHTKTWVAYQSVINNSQLPNRVTISTAVLDNGINIQDQALKHIAILEMNQTSFLQMLGRKRVNKRIGEQVRVYFWARDIGDVKAYFDKSVLRYIKFIIELKFVHQFENPFLYRPYLDNCEAFQNEYQNGDSFVAPFSFYLQKRSTMFGKPNIPGDYSFRIYEPKPLSISRLTYDYYRLAALLEKYSNMTDEQKETEKEVYWLKYQLSWLGLKYDPKKWIDYDNFLNSAKELTHILQKDVLSKEEQVKLKSYFIKFARSNHPPLISTQNKASIKTINKVFQQYNIPYHIESFVKQRKTFWKIHYLAEEEY